MTGRVDASTLRCIKGLLLLLDRQGHVAVLIEQETGEPIRVHCQESGDVVALCEAVIDAHNRPKDSTLQ